jgi:hypothetical protein
MKWRLKQIKVFNFGLSSLARRPRFLFGKILLDFFVGRLWRVVQQLFDCGPRRWLLGGAKIEVVQGELDGRPRPIERFDDPEDVRDLVDFAFNPLRLFARAGNQSETALMSNIRQLR